MSIVSSLPLRLESLAAPPWLAGLLLLVCLMRVGMGGPCAPHDIAELATGSTRPVASAQAGDGQHVQRPVDRRCRWTLPALCILQFSAALSAAQRRVPALTGQDTQGPFSNAPRQPLLPMGAKATNSLNRGSPCPRHVNARTAAVCRSEDFIDAIFTLGARLFACVRRCTDRRGNRQLSPPSDSSLAALRGAVREAWSRSPCRPRPLIQADFRADYRPAQDEGAKTRPSSTLRGYLKRVAVALEQPSGSM